MNLKKNKSLKKKNTLVTEQTRLIHNVGNVQKMTQAVQLMHTKLALIASQTQYLYVTKLTLKILNADNVQNQMIITFVCQI